MTDCRTIVVKVGGSLLGWVEFPHRLRSYLDGTTTDRVVLVTGGGRAADFVRDLDSTYGLGESRSHQLALRALDLTAHVVATVVPGLVVIERPDDLAAVWNSGLIPLLAPRWFLEHVDRENPEPLAASWEVTTDSIAARLADFLGADELRLLKSVGPGATIIDRVEAARSGIVDPAFPLSSAGVPKVTLVNLRDDPPTVHPLD